MNKKKSSRPLFWASGNKSINDLRRRMLITTNIMVTLLIVAGVFLINIYTRNINRQNIRDVLQSYAIYIESSTEGDLPATTEFPDYLVEQPLDEDVSNGFPFDKVILYAVTLDDKGQLSSWESNVNATVSERDLESAAVSATKRHAVFGLLKKYYFYRADDDLILLADNSLGYMYNRSIMVISIISALIIWSCTSFLSMVLVDRMIRPVQDMMDDQTRFISDVEHELKTPIAVIAANTKVLEDELKLSDDNPSGKWLGYIEKENSRMNILVKELLELVAAERPKKSEDLKKFDLAESLLEVALPMEPLAFEKGMMLETDVPDSLMFYGNRKQLSELASILLTNAITYGESGGKIKLSLKHRLGHVTLRVYNDGQGIRPEDREKIFRRFYRVDESRTSENNYGLGLSIARAVAESHGGKISIDGEYGKWVEFIVRLQIKA